MRCDVRGARVYSPLPAEVFALRSLTPRVVLYFRRKSLRLREVSFRRKCPYGESALVRMGVVPVVAFRVGARLRDAYVFTLR